MLTEAIGINGGGLINLNKMCFGGMKRAQMTTTTGFNLSQTFISDGTPDGVVIMGGVINTTKTSNKTQYIVTNINPTTNEINNEEIYYITNNETDWIQMTGTSLLNPTHTGTNTPYITVSNQSISTNITTGAGTNQYLTFAYFYSIKEE